MNDKLPRTTRRYVNGLWIAVILWGILGLIMSGVIGPGVNL